MKIAYAATALALGLAPAAALAQARISPVVSTSMHRTCQGETGRTVLHDASGQSQIGQPQVAPDTRAFRATRSGAGYAFHQSASHSGGQTDLRVDVAATGAISNARLSGSAIEAARAANPQADINALAYSLAQEIPERLLVGRSFAVGDQYYPDDLRNTLIGQMTSAMGLPFPIRGTIDMPYRGESTFNGRRAYVFEGTLQLNGQGAVQGRPVVLTMSSDVRVTHDAETGLVLDYRTAQDLDITLDGQPFQRNRTHDNYTCQIAAQ